MPAFGGMRGWPGIRQCPAITVNLRVERAGSQGSAEIVDSSGRAVAAGRVVGGVASAAR